MTNTTLGKYELLEKLGEGATSDVYRARDTTLGREVALKVLKPALVADAGAFERFAKEAQAAAGLFHPNIATVLDMGAANGRYFIAMRYFPGQSLDKILKSSGPLSWEETLRLAGQIGSALDYAHEQGFLHRDVKPANIIRTPKGEFILTDFGLTRAMMSTGMTSHTGAVLGTPAYIAPEVWNGQAAVPSTDQYALACVVCESLTGQALFAGNTPQAIITRHLINGPEFPASWPPDVPDGLSDVLRRALSMNPAQRYSNMAAFSATCVARITPSSKPVVAVSAPVFQPAPRPLPAQQKDTTAWPMTDLLAIGVLVCIIILGGGWMLRQLMSAPVTQVPIATQTLKPTVIPSLPTATQTALPTATPVPPTPTLIPPTETLIPASPTPTLGIGSTMISELDGMIMVYVPAGEFEMGSNNGQANEKPVHKVYLDAFWIDQTEVTNSMFRKFVDATGYQTEAESKGKSWIFDMTKKSWVLVDGADWQHPKGPDSNLAEFPNYPVVQVSWNNAQAYCEWARRSLPTEAEWEKAARGQDGYVYPWGNQKPDGNLLNFADSNLSVNWSAKSIDDGYKFTAPVGFYPEGASPYGALDMAGNVWEWVSDWYDAYPGNVTSDANFGTKYHVIRGGAWSDVENGVRSTIRFKNAANSRDDHIGFRCALQTKATTSIPTPTILPTSTP